MRARRHVHLDADHGEPVLGYEAATPHLTGRIPAPGRARARVGGRAAAPMVIGALFGLATTSVVVLALLA